MDEWWTYTLSDFLLFSPRTYYRLLERHNQSVWPAHLLTVGLGLVILLLVSRTTGGPGRVISAAVAALWAWVAWSFLWQRYATITWAATYFAWLFAVQVLRLVWVGVARKSLRYRVRRDAAGWAGVA